VMLLTALPLLAFPSFPNSPRAGGGRTVPSKRIGGSPDLPLSALPRRADGGPEQIHITGGSANGLIVVWNANLSEVGVARPSKLSYRVAAGSGHWMEVVGSPSTVYSSLLDPNKFYPSPEADCHGSSNYTSPECYYTSTSIHSVALPTNLPPATTIEYRLDGDLKTRTFRSPPAAGTDRVRFGLVGDLGQTQNSSKTVEGLSAGSYDAILHCGDLSYADGDGPRWDSYGRLLEPLASRVPVASIGGNHEVATGSENWGAFLARYPNNHRNSFSESPLWYSFESGPAHVIMLCSYAGFRRGSSQFGWLQHDLASVDRARTPWVLVVLHTPWYTSNAHHPMTEGSEMRSAMEPLLLAAGVDLLFNGHVHAYERTFPVADGNRVAPHQGIAHVTIGDGGNRENFAYRWMDEQPEWSAIREFAYGYGDLSLNRTHATWRWLRNDDPWNPPPAGKVGDTAVYEVRTTAQRAQMAHAATKRQQVVEEPAR